MHAGAGLCGYNASAQGFGKYTGWLSTALFNGGDACGACFELRCNMDDDRVQAQHRCIPGGSVVITATDLCLPHETLPNDNAEGWCNPPLKHFDLSEPAYRQIAHYKAGIVPVQYKRS